MLRRIGLVGAFALLGGAGMGRAEDTYPILVYPAPRAQEAIQVDGRLVERAWEMAPLVSGFTFYDRPERAPVQTAFRVLFDEERLYIGVVCDEPLADRLPPRPLPRDDASLFHRESVEIFLDPLHDHTHYFQFAVDAAGSLYDAEGYNAIWNSHAQAATQHEKDRWTLEFALPWRDVGLKPERGRVLGLNLCRNRWLEGRQWTNWSQTAANFHDPVRFGHLVLDPTPQEWGRLGEEFRRPNRRGPLLIFEKEGISGQTYRALLQRALDEAERALAELRSLKERQEPAVAAELAQRLEAMEQELGPIRQRLRAPEALDGHTFIQMEQAVHQLLHRMQDLLWEARLAALLAQI